MNNRTIRTVFFIFILVFTFQGEHTHGIVEAVEVIDRTERHRHHHLHHKTKGGK